MYIYIYFGRRFLTFACNYCSYTTNFLFLFPGHGETKLSRIILRLDHSFHCPFGEAVKLTGQRDGRIFFNISLPIFLLPSLVSVEEGGGKKSFHVRRVKRNDSSRTDE